MSNSNQPKVFSKSILANNYKMKNKAHLQISVCVQSEPKITRTPKVRY